MDGVDRVVGINEGRSAWAEQAYHMLVSIAGRYNELITYSDLAEQVQERSGLRTRASQRNWIGGILGDVINRCHGEGVPALTALVVHKQDGQVGAGYDEVLRVAGLRPIDDPLERERHAAAARLDCYRHWNADVPPDAKPTLSRHMQAAVERAHARREQVRGQVCPDCFVEMPAAGACENCR